jgi:hypothetical protein
VRGRRLASVTGCRQPAGKGHGGAAAVLSHTEPSLRRTPGLEFIGSWAQKAFSGGKFTCWANAAVRTYGG